MSGARDTFGHGWQLESETLEINECSQERWDLHVRFRHQANDEVLKGRERRSTRRAGVLDMLLWEGRPNRGIRWSW